MRTVLLASLRIHTRRYVSAALAVVIGVAFVIVTAGLSAAAKEGLTAGVAAPYAGADVVVTGVDGATADRLVRGAPDQNAAAAVLGWSVEVVRHEGTVVDDRADVAQIATDPALRWQTLVGGAYPTRPGEAALDTAAARRLDLRLGDSVEIGAGTRATDVRVVALVDSPSPLVTGSLYLTWDDLHPFAERLYVDSVAWAGPAAGVAALAPDATVTDRDTFVTDRQTDVDNGVDVLAMVLLVFATIALFVGVLVIANTFSILFAQRRQDLAMLRCVGATRRQVLRSIRAESVALGLVATVVGLVVGTLGGTALVALVRSRWPEARLGDASVSLPWYAGGLAVGLLVTVVAAWLPTRRAVRVSPLAALRPDTDTDVRAGSGRVRLALGAVAVVAGVGLLTASVATRQPTVMLAGGTATFTGVLVLGPWLMPTLVRLVGTLTGRLLGTPARLAAGNAVRQPKRTAATAASLLVGVTLTTAVLTGMASSRGALSTEMDAQHPLDAVVVAPDTLPDDLLDDVRRTEDVIDATALAGVTGRVAGVGEITVLGVDDTSLARDRAVVTPGDGEILVPLDLVGADHPAQVEVGLGDRTERLRVVTGEGWGEAALVSAATLTRLGGDPEPRAVWARTAEGVDADALGADLEALAGPVDGSVENGAQRRAYVDLQLDVLTGAVVGLLGIAVVIALVGIANTLGLSVLERAREHALLRALGLTRRQLRGMLAMESVLLSVVATVVGTALGVAFAWVGVQAMVRAVVEDAPMVLPAGQLAVVVAVSAVAGLLACLLPARRAARVSPAEGLATP